jgi:hypothetical protein
VDLANLHQVAEKFFLTMSAATAKEPDWSAKQGASGASAVKGKV